MKYIKFLQEGLIFTFKSILEEIKKNEFSSAKNNLLLTFSTENNSQAYVPDYLKKLYPIEMTILLEDFEDLKIYDHYFEISLIFDEKQEVFELIRIPYNSLIKLEDSTNDFCLEFFTHQDEVYEENIIKVDFSKDN